MICMDLTTPNIEAVKRAYRLANWSGARVSRILCNETLLEYLIFKTSNYTKFRSARYYHKRNCRLL